MSPRHILSVLIGLLLITASGVLEADSDPTYHGDVEPILRRRCLGCHDAKKTEGGLDLSTLESLRAGGEEGPPLVPGEPDESLLYLLVSRQERPFMPPRKSGPMPDGEVEVLRRWIAAGCPPGRKPVAGEPAPVELPRYRRPVPVAALAYGPAGKTLFIGGQREVIVHSRPDWIAGAAYPHARLPVEGEQIRDLEVSPAGDVLAVAGGSAGRFGEVRLFALPSGRSLGALRVGPDTLFDATFASDGSRLAVAGASPEIRVVDVASARVLYEAEIHADWILGTAFVQGDQRLATASRDRAIKVLDAGDGELTRRLELASRGFHCLQARPGTDQFVVGGEGETITLFDGGSLKKLQSLSVPVGEVMALSFSPDGRRLAVAGARPRVVLVRVDDGLKSERVIELEGGALFALSFRPDGEELAASGQDGKVWLLDPAGERPHLELAPFPLGSFAEF